MPLAVRQEWVMRQAPMPVTRQCELLLVTRSVVYARQKRLQKETDELEITLLHLLDEEYTRHPFYGSRRMTHYLRSCGYAVNRKRIQALMRKLGLAGMAPGPNTSKPQPQHKVYPYLLRGMDVVRPNQVWSSDITYIRLSRGFAYLVAVIDWYSRKVLSWRVSNTMDAGFCVECMEAAIKDYGVPEIVNTDQGSQFTSDGFTGVLKNNSIRISMDGRGRALDNIFVERLWRSVKYEDVYLKQYGHMPELLLGLARYFLFYNGERPHQSLGYVTPDVVYRTGAGGGAKIVDRFSAVSESTSSVPLRSTDDVDSETEELGQRHSAVASSGYYLKLTENLS